VLFPNDPGLGHLKILNKDDIKESTMVLNPNQPGSTQSQLSWIWHGVRTRVEDQLPAPINTDGQPDSSAMIECELFF